MAERVEVTWEDAHFELCEPLTIEEIAERSTPATVVNVGFLVVSDRAKVLIASSSTEDAFGVRYRDIMRIPRRMVKKIKRLR